ncbi:cytochrome P450 [Amycolatopsis cynarae]|uniref:Cytochrome P450 n=1 Tax=Amycolatopsis cynarae TaxID=2995223 RepID=A0ABY7B8H9_9PSEU|nr:cytochrome P450 [Amycolatopsis sp. HUAS 11-8]WAL67719.1 cytochrome P450 [Amycolatopsis sp. HUAS 11-8]
MSTSTERMARRDYDPASVSHMSFWAATAEEREVVFKELRHRAPVSWQPPVAGSLAPPENDGYWAVTTNQLIAEVSTNPETFCSGLGVQFEEIPEDHLEAASSFLAMDGERHLSMRRLVSSAFTPKAVARLETMIRDRAVGLVDELLETRSGDFVRQFSQRMPMNTIYDMVGLPPEMRDEAAHLADMLVGWNDPDIAQGREPGQLVSDALVGLLTMGLEFTAQTRRAPREDIWSNLVEAEVGGQRLTDDEIASFFVLVSVAGNDTTRNSISLGAHTFARHPDQRDLLLADFDGRIGAAIEEVVRWATPVMTFRRTATKDTELGGREIRKGDWVAMFYASGNRDETVFEDPERFDITRTPNGHVGFGGGGPHYCLGHFLAKMQLRHVFGQLLHRVPDIEFDTPEFLVGNFVHAVRRLPYSLS